MSILITIAIPTFNNEGTIKKAIESCVSQDDLTDCEILVINNNSTDRTAEICNSFCSRITIITNKTTVSLFENHNIALKEARGQYILFCHSDDMLYPHAISSVKKNLLKRSFTEKYIFWGHSLFRDFSIPLRNSNLRVGQVFSGIFATNPFLTGGLTSSGTCYSRDFLDAGGFLPVEHRIAPSDATSMINAALNGFRFEMVQDIFFYRREASTIGRKVTVGDVLKGYNNAFSKYIVTLDVKTVEDIVCSTYNMKVLPIYFLLLAADISPRVVLRRTLACLLSPGTLKNICSLTFYKTVLIALKKSIFNART